MTASLTILSTVIVGLVTAVASPSTSCTPGEHTAEHHMRNKIDCNLQSTSSTSAFFTCGEKAQLAYDFKRNTIEMMAAHHDDGFTIHGRCLLNGHQVAHLDLHMPTEDSFITEHTYKGMNRVCDIGKAQNPPQLAFFSYAMSANELIGCGNSPVQPIS